MDNIAVPKLDENKKTHFSQKKILYSLLQLLSIFQQKQKFVEVQTQLPLLLLLFTSRMKTHTVAFLVAVLVFATFVTETYCLASQYRRYGKRQLGEKV